MKKLFSKLLMSVLVSTFATSLAMAASETVIKQADGDFVGNRPSGDLARVLFPIAPLQGDSGLAVKTDLVIDREVGEMSLSLVGSKIDKRLRCGVFSIANEATTLFVTKAKRSEELEHKGHRQDRTVKAECEDQKGQRVDAYVSFDTDSYTVILNDGTMNQSNPRFDIVIGPMPKKQN